MNKVYQNAGSAIFDMLDHVTILAGGFGLCGIPENLIQAIKEKGIRNITCISNNAGVDDFGLGKLLQTRQIKKMVSSYVGENNLFEQQYLKGELEVELVPQGTLAERVRAGGAGIPAFFTPTGVGTQVAEGKEKREFEGGVKAILEKAIVADFAIVKAWKGDIYGNLVYRYTARNFNSVMAASGKITIAEVEELTAEPLDPNSVHTSGIYVQRIFQGQNYEKRIEQRTVSK